MQIWMTMRLNQILWVTLTEEMPMATALRKLFLTPFLVKHSNWQQKINLNGTKKADFLKFEKS